MFTNAMKGLVAAVLLSVSSLGLAGQINVNSADAKTLDKELAGVGKVVATRIVSERAKGEYKDIKDLSKRVAGFGTKTAAKNQDKIRFRD